jgi:hypothetical protein
MPLASNDQATGWPEGITEDDAKQLEQWGITPGQAQEARDAVPELLKGAKAAMDGDPVSAFEHLTNAMQAAPELTAKAIAAMTKDMPDGPLKTALNDPQLPTLLGQIADGDWAGAAETFAGDETLLGAAGDALAEIPQVKQLLDGLGIPDPGAALVDALRLGQAVQAGDVKGIAEAALSLARQLDPSAFQGLVDKLPDSVKGFFQNPDVQNIAKALADDPNLPTLIEQLVNQDWGGALETLGQNEALKGAVLDALGNIPQVKQLSERLGISEPGEALADVLKLGQAVQAGDVKGIAEAAISLAGKVDPSVFQGLVDKLPDSVKGFFQSPDVQNVLKALADDPNLPTLIEQLVNQDWDGALETLGQNEALRGAVIGALANIPQVKQLLDTLGISNPGEAFEDVLELGQAVQAGDVKGMVEAAVDLARKLDPKLFAGLVDRLPLPDSVKQFVQKLAGDDLVQSLLSSPQFGPALAELAQGRPGEALKALAQDRDLLLKAGARLAEVLGLPQGVVDTLVAAADLLSDADIGPILQELGSALANRSPEDALAAFQELAGVIAGKATSSDPADQEKMIHLLDAMGHLPGGMGKLFQDPALNEAMVKSGSAGKLVEAAQLLAQGKLEDAAGKLYDAASALLNYGDEKIEVAGQELPFTKEGLQQFANLFGRFFDALPNGVKNKIMDIIGEAVGSAVPIIGDLVTGAMDVGDFIDAIQHGDGLDQLIAGGQLALDAAGMLQLTKAFTQPLKFALSALEAVRTVNDMAQIVSNFQEVFFGMEPDPDQEAKSRDQAISQAYFGTGDLGALEAQYGVDDQGMASLVAAAQACHVDPAHFEAFVNALKDGWNVDDLTGFLNDARAESSGPPDSERMRRAVMQVLQDRDLTELGGRWGTTAFEIGNPDGYVTGQGQADFEATFGDQIPADRWDEVVISPYEALVAQAQALGIPGDQFGAFYAFLQQQGVDVMELAYRLSDKLNWHSAGGDPSRSTFDAAEWLKNGFTGEFSGLVEQFQQAQAPQPLQAAA